MGDDALCLSKLSETMIVTSPMLATARLRGTNVHLAEEHRDRGYDRYSKPTKVVKLATGPSINMKRWSKVRSLFSLHCAFKRDDEDPQINRYRACNILVPGGPSYLTSYSDVSC
jgi:hypothetical protein